MSIRVLLREPSTFVFEAGSLTHLEFTGWKALGIFLFQLPQLLRLQVQAATHKIFVVVFFCFVGWFRFCVHMGSGFWGSNSGPPAYKANTLPTEPSPHHYPSLTLNI